jgi:hypothetical protein
MINAELAIVMTEFARYATFRSAASSRVTRCPKSERCR